jgi:hypothetical protein
LKDTRTTHLCRSPISTHGASANDVAPAGRPIDVHTAAYDGKRAHGNGDGDYVPARNALHPALGCGAALLPSATTRPGATFPGRNDRTHSASAGDRAPARIPLRQWKARRSHGLTPPAAPGNHQPTLILLANHSAGRAARAIMIDEYAATRRRVNHRVPPLVPGCPSQKGLLVSSPSIGKATKRKEGPGAMESKGFQTFTQRPCFAERKSGKETREVQRDEAVPLSLSHLAQIHGVLPSASAQQDRIYWAMMSTASADALGADHSPAPRKNFQARL